MGKEEAEKQWYSDLSRTLETEFGKRVIWKLLGHAGPWRSVTRFVEGLRDEERMPYNAGSQDFGHWLVAQVAKANPKEMQLMILEAYSRKLDSERKQKAEEKDDA